MYLIYLISLKPLTEIEYFKEIEGMSQKKDNVIQMSSKVKKKEFSENSDKKKFTICNMCKNDLSFFCFCEVLIYK